MDIALTDKIALVTGGNSSIYGVSADAYSAGYCASKHGVSGLTPRG